ncbi:MAG: hypothetical protein FWG66_04700 [Spirochaetes bacterium]|nr:hypothetical protein [Spirochaetota bacterium]
MTIEQTVEISADYKIKSQSACEIEHIRRLLQKEMSEQGTSKLATKSGDGWEAYIRERYAEP